MRLKNKFPVLLLLLALSYTQADDKPKPKWHEQKRIAFLVGINRYSATSTLEYAVSDVEKLEDLLLQVGNFTKIVKLTDKGRQVTTPNPKTGGASSSLREANILPTKENIEKTYEDLVKEKPDLLVFYFSGHGFISGDSTGENSIAPQDVRLKPGKPGEAENGISLLELSNKTNSPEFKNTNLVYLIDACRSPLPKNAPPAKTNKGEKSLDGVKDTVPVVTEPAEQKKETRAAFLDTREEISEEIENASGVVMLLGAAPGGSALEDKDFKSGAFSYFLRKAISGGVQNENPEEYVTINSLIYYIESQFKLYNEEEKRPKQELYQLTNNRGFKGDFLLTYGRPPESKVNVEKPLYFDGNEQRNVRSKLIYNKEKKRSDLKFFAKNKRTNRYYPESLDGVARMQYEFEPNAEKSEDFYASQVNLEEEKVFEHRMILIPEKGWEYRGIYKQTETDIKDSQRKDIYFERKIFDFQGNVLLQEYFDRKGKQMSINGVATVLRAYDSFGQKTLEETLDAKEELYAPSTYARYAAIYKSKGNLLSESWYGTDGELSANETGIARTEYIYDKEGKLKSVNHSNQKGEPAADKTGISKTSYSYNEPCLKTKKDRLLKYAQDKKKAEETWKLRGYKVCVTEVLHTDKAGKPAQDTNKIHKMKYSFDEKGNKTSEEFYRADERRWTKNGIAKTKHEYDEDGNIIKTSYFGEYEPEKDKPVPASDERGVHSYQYSYAFNKSDCLQTRKRQGAEYKDYDCADTILHLGINGNPITDKEDIERVRIWYTGANQEEALREYYGSDNFYSRANKVGYIYIYDSGLNQTLYAYYYLKEGKETLDYKYVYDYNDKGNQTLNAKYELKGGKETLDYKYVYDYNEKGNKTLEAYYELKEGKETLQWKNVYDYNEKGNKTLEAYYELKEGKETLQSKNVYDYNEKGNQTLYAYYKLIEGKETLQSKQVYEYNEMGNKTLEARYYLTEGKETLQSKQVYEYNVKGNQTLYAHYYLKEGKETLQSKNVYDYNEKGNNTLEAYYQLEEGKETLQSKYVYDYNEKGNKTLEARYYLKEGKETLQSKYVYDYNEKGNKTLEAYYKLIEGKETLDYKQVYDYNEKGNQTLYAYYGLKEGKETLHYKYVYEYNVKGNNTLTAYYGLKEGKETLHWKYVYDYNEKGNQTLLAYYRLIDGKETLQWKEVSEYNTSGNKSLGAFYQLKDGKETLIKQTIYDEEAGEVETDYKNKLDRIVKEIKRDAKLNDSDSYSTKKYNAEQLAKELTDKSKGSEFLRRIDDASKEFESKQKKYTIIKEELNDDSSFKTQEYKLLFANPRGSFEKRLIRVDLDRFYRPVGIGFEEK